MRSFANISANVFLCLYSLILLHNTIPHAHAELHGEPLHYHELTAHAAHNHQHLKHQYHDHIHGDLHHHGDSEEHGLLEYILDFFGGFHKHNVDENPEDQHVGEDVVLRIAKQNPRVLAGVLPIFAPSVLPLQHTRLLFPPPIPGPRPLLLSTNFTPRGPPVLA